jgi:hypothetical protein
MLVVMETLLQVIKLAVAVVAVHLLLEQTEQLVVAVMVEMVPLVQLVVHPLLTLAAAVLVLNGAVAELQVQAAQVVVEVLEIKLLELLEQLISAVAVVVVQ